MHTRGEGDGEWKGLALILALIPNEGQARARAPLNCKGQKARKEGQAETSKDHAQSRATPKGHTEARVTPKQGSHPSKDHAQSRATPKGQRPSKDHARARAKQGPHPSKGHPRAAAKQGPHPSKGHAQIATPNPKAHAQGPRPNKGYTRPRHIQGTRPTGSGNGGVGCKGRGHRNRGGLEGLEPP